MKKPKLYAIPNPKPWPKVAPSSLPSCYRNQDWSGEIFEYLQKICGGSEEAASRELGCPLMFLLLTASTYSGSHC